MGFIHFFIFSLALGALSKKKSNFKAGKTEAKGRDADDEGAKKGTSRAMKMMFQMDGMFSFLRDVVSLKLFLSVVQ